MVRRRDVLRMISAAGAAGTVGLGFPRLGFASLPTDARLVMIFCEGGIDGLSAVPPHGDPDYWRWRGHISPGKPGEPGGIVELDGFFGLHPTLSPLHELYRKGELLPFHALASPSRERSHAEAMKTLQGGGEGPHDTTTGWFNRALKHYGVAGGEKALGLMGMPFVLMGDLPVGAWTPNALKVTDLELRFVEALYSTDPVLGPAFAAGRRMAALAEATLPPGQSIPARPIEDPTGLPAALSVAGAMLAVEKGPRIAAVEVGNYDSHGNQEGPEGLLTTRLPAIATGIRALEARLGPAWRHTVVFAMTEFGRAVIVNGSRGTDHGTGGMAIVAGGAVKGGRVFANWPGLKENQLFEGRDLKPGGDTRSLFKAILRDHLGLPEGFIEDTVFPKSREARPFEGLFRTPAPRA